MSYITEGVAEYVKTLFPEGYKGVAVDVGAYHSDWINNTWLFEQEGWDVYCIEPNPHCLDELSANRKNVYAFAAGPKNLEDQDLFIMKAGHGPNGEAGGTGLINHPPEGTPNSKWFIPVGTEVEVIKVKVRSLDWFLDQIGVEKLDYLSVDVEHYELQVLQGINLDKWKVKVMAIENIDDGTYDEELHKYIVSKGFEKVNRIMVNDIYRRV